MLSEVGFDVVDFGLGADYGSDGDVVTGEKLFEDVRAQEAVGSGEEDAVGGHFGSDLESVGFDV